SHLVTFPQEKRDQPLAATQGSSRSPDWEMAHPIVLTNESHPSVRRNDRMGAPFFPRRLPADFSLPPGGAKARRIPMSRGSISREAPSRRGCLRCCRDRASSFLILIVLVISQFLLVGE